MAEAVFSGGMSVSSPRRRRSAAERRLIVEETLAAGSSVARVALKHGVNANQVFKWKRLYEAGRAGAQLVQFFAKSFGGMERQPADAVALQTAMQRRAGQPRDRGVERIKTVVQWQEGVPAKRYDNGFLLQGGHRGAGSLGPVRRCVVESRFLLFTPSSG
jgi:transposase-like protein